MMSRGMAAMCVASAPMMMPNASRRLRGRGRGSSRRYSGLRGKKRCDGEQRQQENGFHSNSLGSDRPSPYWTIFASQSRHAMNWLSRRVPSHNGSTRWHREGSGRLADKFQLFQPKNNRSLVGDNLGLPYHYDAHHAQCHETEPENHALL